MFGVFPISLLMLLYIVSVRITTATFFVVLHNFFDIVKVIQLFLPNSIVETVSIGLGGYLDAALYPESRAFFGNVLSDLFSDARNTDIVAAGLQQ